MYLPNSVCNIIIYLFISRPSKSWQWPFCYVNAGGIRLLVTGETHGMRGSKGENGKERRQEEREEHKDEDDAFILTVSTIQCIIETLHPISHCAIGYTP